VTIRRALTAAWLASLAIGCRSGKAKSDAGVAAQGQLDASALASDGGVGSTAPELFASPASRCGQCHGAFEAQWRASAHARSESAPAYVAMRSHADAAACDGCHAPLDRMLAPDDPAQHDGVNCDVCHTMSDVTPRKSGGGFVLHVDDMTKYGPLCDAKNNYFHKVSCSPLHARSEMCAACHLMYTRTPSQDLPVFTEYEEWQASRYGAIDQTCQDCHMPEQASAVAVGAKRRGGVARHDFGASDPHFRAGALTVRASLDDHDGALVVHATLRNDGAGHSVPTGLPERRVVLRVTTFDDANKRVDRVERAYGRVLVDAQGLPAPFYEAARVGSDTRLKVDEQRDESIPLSIATAGQVQVDVVWQPMAPDIASKLEVPLQEVVLQHGVTRIEAPARRRAGTAPIRMAVVP